MVLGLPPLLNPMCGALDPLGSFHRRLAADSMVKGITPISEVRLGILRAAARWSGGLNVAGGRAFLTLFHVERHLLALSKCPEASASDGALVNKNILAPIRPGDKAKTFGFVKPLNYARNHW